jgi:hypothetical protein
MALDVSTRLQAEIEAHKLLLEALLVAVSRQFPDRVGFLRDVAEKTQARVKAFQWHYAAPEEAEELRVLMQGHVDESVSAAIAALSPRGSDG